MVIEDSWKKNDLLLPCRESNFDLPRGGGDTDHYTTEENNDAHKKYFFHFNWSLSLAEKKLFLAPGEKSNPGLQRYRRGYRTLHL